jgi:hypothetical protein
MPRDIPGAAAGTKVPTEHHLFAVLLDDTATVETVDAQLTAAMRRPMRYGRLAGYRFGGQFTGAWDPQYDPEANPANWRPCIDCANTTKPYGRRCTICAAGTVLGRPAGSVLIERGSRAAHPGDIVPLARLMEPTWRFPATGTPHAWVDGAGVVWLDTPRATPSGDTGQVAPPLRRVFDDFLSGRRNPEPGLPVARRRFDESTWQVAVVDAYR